MIIDKLKEFIARFTDSSLKNDCCGEESIGEVTLGGDTEYEEEVGENEIRNISEEPFGGIAPLEHDMDIEDVYDPRIPYDEVDEPTPCVYGPPSWYDNNGNLNPDNPDAKRFIDEIDAIEERNRRRAELRKLRQMEIEYSIVNKPQPKVYGPKP